jgi:hypothetical protein
MKFITNYFNGERAESIVFVLIGFIAVGLSIYFWLGNRGEAFKGAAIALTLIALIQITVGGIIVWRSPKDVVRVTQIVQSEPSRIQSEEIPRMNAVMKNFETYRYIEIALIIIGIALFFVLPNKPFWKGLGIALALQAALMLAFDYVAESRGKVYLKHLQKIKTA